MKCKLFDEIHRRFFSELFNLSDAELEKLATEMRAKGISDTDILRQLARINMVHEGKTYGHAHAVDAASIIEKAFYKENVKRLVLEISADYIEGYPDTYDGHLDIRIKEVEPWNDGVEGEGDSNGKNNRTGG
ncbi:MAG: hypothetical protein ACYS1A_08305 [Planctomycetota bacterium]|jgi:hypothetical protein